MKTILHLLASLALLACGPAFAQSAEKTPAPARQLTKFNLDFPGGTPGALAAAIQKALGRPLNVLVPADDASYLLPPLKMNGVDAVQLFAALEMVGPRIESVATGNGGYSQFQTMAGFKTRDLPNATDDSIWTFYVNGNRSRLPKVSRFYLLTPYLEAGLSVEDITTAVQTGWKMRGDTDLPTLSFHKETKLLIAYGDYSGLDTIEAVLKALDAVKNKPVAKDAPAAEAKKTK